MTELITGIVRDPRKPGRFAIAANGRELATLSIEAIERLRLGTGTPLDDRLRMEIDREAAVLATYDRALNMLAARARSAVELRRLLVRKGEPADQVDVAIERLRAVGFIDDASFARQFTRSKAVGAGLSRRRVQQELARRGVARDVSTDAIDEVFEEEAVDESASIERVARKKMRTLGGAEPAAQRRRLYGFLARRGYESDEIRRVVALLLNGDGEDDGVDEGGDD